MNRTRVAAVLAALTTMAVPASAGAAETTPYGVWGPAPWPTEYRDMLLASTPGIVDPLSVAGGTCTTAGPADVAASSPLTTAYAGGFRKITAPAGAVPAGWSSTGGGSPVGWRRAAPMAAGSTPTLSATCAGTGEGVQWQLYPRPSAGFGFTGENAGAATVAHELGWAVRGPMQHALAVGVEGGSATVTVGGVAYEIPETVGGLAGRPSRIPVGRLTTGTLVDAAVTTTGPAARWRVTLTGPEGVGGGGLRTHDATSNGERGFAATFVLGESESGMPTRIDVVAADGTILRNLVAEQPIDGQVEIAWDGRDATGRAMPDGNYWLMSYTAFPHGIGSGSGMGVTLDSTPPAVVVPRAPEGAGGDFVVDADDAQTAVDDVVLEVDGATVPTRAVAGAARVRARAASSARSYAFRPGRAWSAGAHRWRLRVTDDAGNAVVRSGTFTVAATPSDVTPKRTDERPKAKTLVACAFKTVRHAAKIQARGLKCDAARKAVARLVKSGGKRDARSGLRCTRRGAAVTCTTRKGAEVRFRVPSKAAARLS